MSMYVKSCAAVPVLLISRCWRIEIDLGSASESESENRRGHDDHSS